MCFKNITVMSIRSSSAQQIFEGTKKFEFRKTPLRLFDLNEKIYVYSSQEDRALIGYMRVSKILKGDTTQILKLTGYDVRPDGNEIVDYYGENYQNCCALKLYDVTKFEKPLLLKDMRRVDPNIELSKYYTYIPEPEPLYDVIREWDQSFSSNGNLCKDFAQQKRRILQRGIERARNK